MDGANIERISKALADETRLLIFKAIANNNEINCSKIAALRRVTLATVSHHLKILSHVGLIECRRQRQFVHNRAVPEMIENYARLSRPKKQSRCWILPIFRVDRRADRCYAVSRVHMRGTPRVPELGEHVPTFRMNCVRDSPPPRDLLVRIQAGRPEPSAACNRNRSRFRNYEPTV